MASDVSSKQWEREIKRHKRERERMGERELESRRERKSERERVKDCCAELQRAVVRCWSFELSAPVSLFPPHNPLCQVASHPDPRSQCVRPLFKLHVN